MARAVHYFHFYLLTLCTVGSKTLTLNMHKIRNNINPYDKALKLVLHVILFLCVDLALGQI